MNRLKYVVDVFFENAPKIYFRKVLHLESIYSEVFTEMNQLKYIVDFFAKNIIKTVFLKI